MPKWIYCVKRWRSKFDKNQNETKEKALHEDLQSIYGATLSCDSRRCSLSPLGSSEGEQDKGDTTTEDAWSTHKGISTTLETVEEPLDLSAKGKRSHHHNGTKDEKNLLLIPARRDLPAAEAGMAPYLDMVGTALQLHIGRCSLNREMLSHPRRFHLLPSPEKAKAPAAAARKRHLSATPESDDPEDRLPKAQATPEAVAKLERIENKIGKYDCKLCGDNFPNAIELANHNCPAIAKEEYRCPECGKKFQCPANLASHRRWHGRWALNSDTTSPVVTVTKGTESPTATGNAT